MKAAPFTYHDPASLDDLIGLLGTLEDVKLLAGGQSLIAHAEHAFFSAGSRY